MDLILCAGLFLIIGLAAGSNLVTRESYRRGWRDCETFILENAKRIEWSIAEGFDK